MPVRAFKCPLNPGFIDEIGNVIYHPSIIWVDGILIAAVGVANMRLALAAVIEAVFTVLGQPDTTKRQCPLATDKWLDLIAEETQTALGLVVNTRKLTVGIPRKYLNETLSLLSKVWPKNRKRFTAIEALKWLASWPA